MAAPKKNQFWKQRSKHGRDKLFETPELLWEASCEYFKWCDDNPLLEEKLFHYQGVVSRDVITKLRAYTLSGLCIFLDCTEDYFRSFKSQDRINKEDFITVINKIDKIIYNQKFTGAAADLLNSNIIARDLGLSDKKEIKSDLTVEHIDYEKLSPEALEEIANQNTEENNN